jgi:hypothetical protein
MILQAFLLACSGLAVAAQSVGKIEIRRDEDAKMFTPLEGTAAEGTVVRFSSSANELSLYGWSGEQPCDAPTGMVCHYTVQNMAGSGVEMKIIASECQTMFFSTLDPAEFCDTGYIFSLHIEQSQADPLPSSTSPPISVDTDCATTSLITSRPTLVKKPSPSRIRFQPQGPSGASSTPPLPTYLEKLRGHGPTDSTYSRYSTYSGYSDLPPQQTLTVPGMPPPRATGNSTISLLGPSPSVQALPATGGSTSAVSPHSFVIAIFASHVICMLIFW